MPQGFRYQREHRLQLKTQRPIIFPGMGQKVTCSYKESEATVAIDDPPLKMHF